jgi:DMSO/TMAO reductase YedYZ molybdopterin-dependent catalytic subunit
MKSGPSRREWLLLGAGLAYGQTNFSPTDELFVRNHFDEPILLLRSWKLRVEGHVAHPLELTFSDLLEMPPIKLEAVLECAGNGETGGGIGTGIWEGASIGQVLHDAGADPSADVLLEGFDQGQLLRDRLRTAYQRIVPQAKCRAPESMLAYKRNGRFLPRRNGFPVRALFPGWYGMDAVKWLRRIVVLGRDELPPLYRQSGMQQLYSRLRNGSSPHRIDRIAVKSMIAYPRNGAKLATARYNVEGYAWTGAKYVQQVEVSIDGGKSWRLAKLGPAPNRFTWLKWSYEWNAGPGEHVLMSRAQDGDGNIQPLTRDSSRLDSYELNWCAPVRCTVI